MVTRSPIRKLGAEDRLVGPCTQCEKRGLPHEYLMKGIAMVLLLDSEDEEAVELQTYIQENGIEKALEHYSGINEGSEMQKTIIRYYNELKLIRDLHK